MQKHNPTKDHVKHLKKMASKLGGTSSVRMDAIVVKTIEHDKKIHGLIIGSDVEIAKRVQKDLIKQYGDLVHAEGAFWRFRKTRWDAIPEYKLRLTIHAYDGAIYYPPSGFPAAVKLGKGRIDSIINECAVLCAAPTFFDERQFGINCASGFIRFATDGSTTLEPHKSGSPLPPYITRTLASRGQCDATRDFTAA